MKVATFGEGDKALDMAIELMITVATRYAKAEFEKQHLYLAMLTLLNSMVYAASSARAKTKATQKTDTQKEADTLKTDKQKTDTQKTDKKKKADTLQTDKHFIDTREDPNEGPAGKKARVESKSESSAGADSAAGAPSTYSTNTGIYSPPSPPPYYSLPGPSFEIETDLDTDFEIEIERMLSNSATP